MSQLSIFARNENCDFKMVHLTPIRMAPLNSPYFSSHECIFLGCLELYYRSRYRQQAREFMRKMKEKWVARGGLFLRGRKHRHTFPRGPTIQCLLIRTISYNNSCQRIVRNYLQGHSTEIPFLSNVFKKSAIFQAKNFFSFMFHSLNRHPNQTQLPRTPSQHNKDLYSNEVAHIKSSRK
jgi:hypothetical protein